MLKYEKSLPTQTLHTDSIKYHMLISKKFEKLIKIYDLPIEYTVVEDNLMKEIIENGTDNEKH